MTTNARLTDVFGGEAVQDISSLQFSYSPNLTAEGILVELLARLLALQSFPLELEQGGVLQLENGRPIHGSIATLKIEVEHYETVLRPSSRTIKIFLATNEDI